MASERRECERWRASAASASARAPWASARARSGSASPAAWEPNDSPWRARRGGARPGARQAMMCREHSNANRRVFVRCWQDEFWYDVCPRGCAPPSHLRQAPRVHRAAARQPLAPDAGRMVSCHARRMQSGPKSLAGASAGGRMPGDRAPLLHAHDPNRLKNRPHALRDTPTRTCRPRSTRSDG